MTNRPTKKQKRECEDCGDTIPDHQRRVRCKTCGSLLCAWCFHHVHVGLAVGKDN
jgi:ribosomal protein S27AE